MKPVPKRVFYNGFLSSYEYLFANAAIRPQRLGTINIFEGRGMATLYLYIPYPSFFQ